MINPVDVILLSIIIFSIGICGFFIHRKNILSLLMCFELLLVAISMNFIVFSQYRGISGQVMTLFMLSISAAELAIGLSILIVYIRYNKKKSFV